ncbi:FapA family protein [Virgibacillus sp. C22-A2]|uniref:FapA family protein n=1 Tax=Virgibacillus tibetensis TaxID=3042313 RepID=A0ABU6KBG1_9BACI|nr:FapA family protein [Virgibacillus sp. C22-A2]
MGFLNEFFYVTVSADRMTAQIHSKETYNKMDAEITEESLDQLLSDNKIVYGIHQDNFVAILTDLPVESYPLIIAKGNAAINGKDGKVLYEMDFTAEIDRAKDWNFREVMRIPSVNIGQKLAKKEEPTKGLEGTDVFGMSLPALPGKPAIDKAGKNVVYREEDSTFYATSEGQLSVSGGKIQVQPIFTVNETLSMKNGNLDFVGTIIIHGDVPTGYTVKADGDVKIFGMVEAATVIAGGSIYISEGLAGLKQGTIKASENITISYINQGSAFAGNDLYVENSILHSECTARNHVYCQNGNIIGGSLSAGKSIEAKDIGNRMSTHTEIVFGINKMIGEQEISLMEKKKELQDTITKLTILGKKMEAQNPSQDPKLRVTLLKQKNSLNKALEQLKEVSQKLEQTDSHIGSEREARLVVRNHLYSNVMVTFGKYKRLVDQNHHYVQMEIVNNEITLQPLFI